MKLTRSFWSSSLSLTSCCASWTWTSCVLHGQAHYPSRSCRWPGTRSLQRCPQCLHHRPCPRHSTGPCPRLTLMPTAWLAMTSRDLHFSPRFLRDHAVHVRVSTNVCLRSLWIGQLGLDDGVGNLHGPVLSGDLAPRKPLACALLAGTAFLLALNVELGRPPDAFTADILFQQKLEPISVSVGSPSSSSDLNRRFLASAQTCSRMHARFACII